MKKKRELIVSIIVLVIILVIIIVGIGISKRNGEVKKVQDSIESAYQELESNIKNYNSNREMISEKLDDYYTDNLEGDYDYFIKILKEQESIVDSIKSSTDNLGKKCGNRLYSKGNINKICKNYKDYNEMVNNVFVNDYIEINKIIDSYNKSNNKKLDLYQSDIGDYIDYNNDGKYLGR